MKIICIDKTDPYSEVLVLQVKSDELSGLATGYERSKSKIGDELSLRHARDSTIVAAKMSSADYHWLNLQDALTAFRAAAIELGVMKKEPKP